MISRSAYAFGLLALTWVLLTSQGASAQTAADPALAHAFVGVDVVDVEHGVVIPDQTVVVEGDRIAAVGPRSATRVPPGARTIDGAGRYLMPGLIDAHVHFAGENRAGDLALYLGNSVTTIRNMNATSAPAIMDWQREVVAGERLGPTILTTGPTVRQLADSAAAERVVREHVVIGYDAIKVYSGVDSASYRILMRRAAEAGVPVVGHVPVQVGVLGAVTAGQRTLEHAEDLMQVHAANQPDTTRLPSLIAALRRAPDVCVVPTLVVFANVDRHLAQFPHLYELMAREQLAFVDASLRSAWAPANNSYVQRLAGDTARAAQLARRTAEQLAFMKQMVGAMHAAGVRIVAGSDANVPHTVPGFSLEEELHHLTSAGLTRADALRSATTTAAACLGMAAEVGAVRPGLRADLVLLEANPLENLDALQRRVGLMARGRWLTDEELMRRMAERPAR